MKWILPLFGLFIGCRHCPIHSTSKPKIEHEYSSRIESGTKLWAEGFGPNQYSKTHNPSPYEYLDLKGILEYKMKW